MNLRLMIAVVDDDTRFRRAIGELLESAGQDVQLYEDAMTLLQSRDFDRFDCIVSDVRMPVVDGFELRKLSWARRPDLPVLLMSGCTETAGTCPLSLPIYRKSADIDRLLAAVTSIATQTR